MKRIAILTNAFPPDASGGSVNVSTIASELIKQGHKVKVFTASGVQYESDDKNLIYRIKYGFFTGKIKRVSEEISSRTNNSRIRYFCILLESLLTGSMKKEIVRFRPDILITVCFPFRNVMIGRQLKEKMPAVRWYQYYVDPFFSNPQYGFSSVSYILKKERKILKKADRVIMLKWMAGEYLKHKAVDKRKLKAVDLPLSIYECQKNPRESETLQIIYTGQLYKDMRDPSAAFRCLAKALNGSGQPYRLTVVGNIHGFTDSEKKQWGSDFNGRLTIAGAVPPDKVGSYYDKADILLSIGNSSAELMPSKVLQYIGTGKPVIHFYKRDDCPSKTLFSRYGNALCVSEKECDSSKIIGFISSRKNADPLPREEILREFSEYDIRNIVKAFLK